MRIVIVSLLALLSILSVAIQADANDAINKQYLDWFKPANAKIRVASTYLRTGNVDFAALALEEVIARKIPKDLSKDLSGLINETISQAKSALALIDNNESDRARQALLKLREQLFQEHQARKIEVFDDCIWALTKRGPALWKFRKNRPDLNDKKQSQAVVMAAANYLAQLNKCDKLAAAPLRKKEDYYRLVKGARESLERIPTEAIAEKDGGLLYRFIIELRSFDRLLYFRFG